MTYTDLIGENSLLHLTQILPPRQAANAQHCAGPSLVHKRHSEQGLPDRPTPSLHHSSSGRPGSGGGVGRLGVVSRVEERRDEFVRRAASKFSYSD
jgi:hypothetical protein